MLTSAHMLAWLADPWKQHRREPRPDVEVVELGAWDHARNVSSEDAFREPLGAFLENWRASARAAAPPAPAAVFATMPTSFFPGDLGRFEKGLLPADAPLFLNRAAAHADLAASASLAAVCPCLADDGYHPAALQNAWDVQRLLNLVLAAPPAEPPTRLRLRAPGFRACCCAPPAPNRTNGNIAHWARVCVPDD